jgi:hypothetical protein
MKGDSFFFNLIYKNTLALFIYIYVNVEIIFLKFKKKLCFNFENEIKEESKIIILL